MQHQDFATEALAWPPGSLSDRVSISAATLCAYVEYAEKEAVVAEQARGVLGSIKSWVRKRRREDTPPEELKQKFGRNFRDGEERAQAEENNSSYKVSSAS
jgi:hypothetical protein